MNGVVAISGTHGTGKTTSVLDLCRDLKIKFPGKNIVPLIERASLSPYPINKDATEKSQMWMFTSHISEELYYTNKFDIVVSDRSAVDMIAYTQYLGFTGLAEKMLSIVRHHMPIYLAIHFQFAGENDFWFPDGLRESEDRQFRQCVEDVLLNIYGELGLEFSSSVKCLSGAGLCETGLS